MGDTAPRPAGRKAVRKAPARTAAVCAAGLALVMGAAGAGHAAASTGAQGAQQAVPQCGEAAATGGAETAHVADAPAVPFARPAGTGQPLAFDLPRQAPVGLWTTAGLTLRAPVVKGTAHLDVGSTGFSTDSLEVQRYVPQTRQWVDLSSAPSTTSRPRHATFSFPVSTAASSAHPYRVALRFQDLDRPGTFTVATSVADGHGHVYRAPARSAAATRPAVSVSGWAARTALVRGGAARSFTVTVRNTTDRPYPALGAGYFLYGAGTKDTLVAADVRLQEYLPGRGWVRVTVVPDGCDPGLGASLPAVRQGALEPGAAAVYRLRVAVTSATPTDVTAVDAGVSVASGDTPLFSQQLPFTVARG